MGIAISEQSEVFVANYGNHRVQVFDGEGKLLRAWNELDGEPEQFWTPIGLQIGPEGHVWVVDSFNHRGQVSTTQGELVRIFDDIGQGPQIVSINQAGEFWVLSGRLNHLWQSLYDDKRKPHLIQRFPASFIEINPDDADRLDIISGDMVAIESERVHTAEGTISSGAITTAAYVTDEVPPSVIFTMFHYPGSPSNAVITADASTTPINPRQPFKFGRGTVTRIGSTELADVMPFTPRNIV